MSMTEPIDKEGKPEETTEKGETFAGHKVIPQIKFEDSDAQQTKEDSPKSEVTDEMLANFLEYFGTARHKLVMDLKPTTGVYYKFNERIFQYREEYMGQMRGSSNSSDKLYTLTGMLDGSRYYYTDKDIANIKEGIYEKFERKELAMVAGFIPRDNDPVEALIKDTEAEVTFSTLDQLNRLYTASEIYNSLGGEFKRKLYSGKNYKIDGSNPEVLAKCSNDSRLQDRIIPTS